MFFVVNLFDYVFVCVIRVLFDVDVIRSGVVSTNYAMLKSICVIKIEF